MEDYTYLEWERHFDFTRHKLCLATGSPECDSYVMYGLMNSTTFQNFV